MSGTPRRSNEPARGGYDATLAYATPALTKEQIQGGYDPNLLTTTPAYSSPPSANECDVENNHAGGDMYPLQEPRALPLWKTPRGIALIVLAVVLVLGAIIGGAVGGSLAGKHSNPSSLTGSNASASPLPAFTIGPIHTSAP